MLEGDGEDPSQDRLGGHEGNVRVSEHEISMGREGIQHRTEARVVQRNITSGGDGEDPSQDRLGGHEQGNVRVSEHEISMGREGIQHWTEARVVQRNITSGGSAACHLGGSVKQQGTVLLVTDVRRAHFHANARRRVYIELPEGDGGGSGSRQWAAEKELGRHP